MALTTPARICCVFLCALTCLSGLALSACTGLPDASEESVSEKEQERLRIRQQRIADRRISGSKDQVAEPTGDPVCDLVNQERVTWNCGQLTVSEALMKAAAIRVEEAAKADPNALHIRPAGTDWSTVLPEVHSSAKICGETVLMGGADAETAVSAMLLSLDQTDYLICEKYKHIGYAHNNTCDLWVLVFSE